MKAKIDIAGAFVFAPLMHKVIICEQNALHDETGYIPVVYLGKEAAIFVEGVLCYGTRIL